MVKIITIEGNIGSGKSTLINRLKKENKDNLIYFLPEPVDQWNTIKDSGGVTILERYYRDKKKYSFSFQMMAYITRLSQIRNCIKTLPSDAIIITERCLYTDRYVFAKMLYDTGFIEEIEYTIYIKWFSEFEEYSKLDKIIYIKTDPEVCQERINKRNRKGEENIPLSYLQDCHTYHENWIEMEDDLNTHRIVIDGNQNAIDTSQIFNSLK
jgi:deoxyadenosine/deoxycytidine kinase